MKVFLYVLLILFIIGAFFRWMGDDAIEILTCSPADSSMCAGWAVDRL